MECHEIVVGVLAALVGPDDSAFNLQLQSGVEYWTLYDIVDHRSAIMSKLNFVPCVNGV